MVTKFEVGKTYSSRSIGDHNCIFTVTILSRSPKMVKIRNWDGTVKSTKIRIDDNVEWIMPERYSFAPVYRANRTIY